MLSHRLVNSNEAVQVNMFLKMGRIAEGEHPQPTTSPSEFRVANEGSLSLLKYLMYKLANSSPRLPGWPYRNNNDSRLENHIMQIVVALIEKCEDLEEVTA